MGRSGSGALSRLGGAAGFGAGSTGRGGVFKGVVVGIYHISDYTISLTFQVVAESVQSFCRA